MTTPVTIQGTLQSDGTLKFDQPPSLAPGPVLVTLAAGPGANGDRNGRELPGDENTPKQRFEKLAASWKAKTKFLSNVTTKILNADYQKIIGMGKDAVPFILDDLADNGPNDWFWALTAITDVNPIKPEMAGNMVAMTEAWLQWGTQAGYLKDYPRMTNKSSRMTDYEVASPRDSTYNCIAFAAGDTARKWDPNMLLQPGYYWPPGALREDGDNDINALKRAFEEIGYAQCDNGELEAGFQKVALYAIREESWQHAALQDATGAWVSKLGDEYDVRHKSPHCFEGSIYGKVACFMKRRSLS